MKRVVVTAIWDDGNPSRDRPGSERRGLAGSAGRAGGPGPGDAEGARDQGDDRVVGAGVSLAAAAPNAAEPDSLGHGDELLKHELSVREPMTLSLGNVLAVCAGTGLGVPNW